MCLPAAARSGQLEIIDHRTEEEGLFNNTVTAVLPAGDTGVFIASAGGLHVLSDFFFLPLFQKIPATALSQDPGGDLWAATDSGLIYRITDRDDTWTAIRFPFDGGKKITAIAARHDAVTIGTDHGLYYAGPDGTTHTIMREGAFFALAAPEDGTIVAGANDPAHKNGGLVIIGGTFASRTGWVEELSGTTVSAIFVDGDRLLIGTKEGGAFILDDAGVRNIELSGKPGMIRAILVNGAATMIGSDTGLFISTNGVPFELLSSEGNGRPSGITSLAPGPGGTVWVGTRADGIYLVRVRPWGDVLPVASAATRTKLCFLLV